MVGLPIHVATSGSSDFTCQLQAPQVRAPVGEADSMPLFVVHTEVAGHFPSSTLLGPKLMETPRFRGRGTPLKVMIGEPQHHIAETQRTGDVGEMFAKSATSPENPPLQSWGWWVVTSYAACLLGFLSICHLSFLFPSLLFFIFIFVK